jgi:hypothetical protein
MLSWEESNMIFGKVFLISYKKGYSDEIYVALQSEFEDEGVLFIVNKSMAGGILRVLPYEYTIIREISLN